MGNTANVCVWASVDGVMNSPKRCDYASKARVWLKKGVYVMQSLMKGKDFSKHSRYIYIYIYIYMKADKGVAEIKFCYPTFAREGKL